MRQESSWLSLYKQDVCEQLVKTHYEVVRGLALAMAFVEYQHQATVADDADDEPSENVRSKLRARVLAHLSNYHMLLWSAGRSLVVSSSLDQLVAVLAHLSSYHMLPWSAGRSLITALIYSPNICRCMLECWQGADIRRKRRLHRGRSAKPSASACTQDAAVALPRGTLLAVYLLY